MSVAPKTRPVVLPASHPFARLTVAQFENLFGPHAFVVISNPIPRVENSR